MQNPLIEFCLPIYNEEKIMEQNIKKLLSFLIFRKYKYPWGIVLLINGSSDASPSIGEKLAAEFPGQIKTIISAEKGKSRTIKNYFLKSQAEYLLYMDIDLAVSLNNIDQLLYFLIEENNDLVIGSRFLKNSKTKRSIGRKIISKIYSLLARLVLNHKILDLQCGFKGIKNKVFRNISPFLKSQNWFLDTELILFSLKIGYKIKEIPVDWEDGRYETRKSKVKIISDGLRFARDLFDLRHRLKNIK